MSLSESGNHKGDVLNTSQIYDTWIDDHRLLFEKHLMTRLEKLYDIMRQHNITCFVIHSGHLTYYYQDDQHYPLKMNPWFRYLCPMEGSGHYLVIYPEEKVELFYYQPQDFWHYCAPVEEYSIFMSLYKLHIMDQNHRGFEYVLSCINQNKTGTVVYLGDEPKLPEIFQSCSEGVLQDLFLMRMYKTAWEVSCIRKATEIALKGHYALKNVFYDQDMNLSEKDLYFMYTQQTQHRESEFPYFPIIACDEHAAVLHYNMQHHRCGGLVLLVDAGASYCGYGSDISRTWLKRLKSCSLKNVRSISGGSISHAAYEAYSEMLSSLDSLQQQLVSNIEVGLSFEELHGRSMDGVYNILRQVGLVQSAGFEDSLSQQERRACAKAFYPHGVGHMLGLQVHDVNIDRMDNKKESSITSHLRNYRQIDVGYLFTVEPGIYFIKQCILQFQREYPNIKLDQNLLEELYVFGGMRIEDNVYVGSHGVENITRQIENAL